MMQVTLQLPDRIYEQARRWATITNQELDVALTEALEIALTSVHAYPVVDEPITSLGDDELLALAQAQIPMVGLPRLQPLQGR